jgi:hypothetical protein
MKKNIFKMLLGAALVSLGLTAQTSNAQTQPPGDFLNGFDNATSGGPNSTAGWIYWYNGAGTVGLDTAVKNTGAGSLKVTIPFTLPFRTVDQAAFFGNWDEVGAYDTTIVYDGTFFTNISYDILMDPSDPVSSNGDFGTFGVGLIDAGTPAGARVSGATLIPGSASNTWFTVNQPVHKTDGTYLSSPGVIGVSFRYTTYDAGNTFLTNPVTLHLDNLHVWLGPTSNPPPPLYITNVTQGLNFVQGSISSQFDRQNIRTLNSPTINYSWVGAATVGNPVTYSFNITKWSAPDLNYHIYFASEVGAGGASAIDYNQTNVMILQVSQLSNSQAVATITWKTNSPQSGTTGTSLTITNPTVLGNWQVQFTSDTNGAVIPPGGSPQPFLVDPALAAGLANPIYVTFGLNPSVNTNTILGESIVVSQIGITGVGSLSLLGPVTTDNFMTDGSLDTTNIWQVNALFPASILYVPTNTAYGLAWTLPASGLVPEVNTNVAGGTWNVLQLQSSVLQPGKFAFVPKSALPAGSKAFFRLAKLVPTQMQVLLPGETNAPNTVNGKVGTPTAAPVGTGVLVTVNVVDATWNVVPINGDSISYTSTDTTAILPGNGSFVNGTTSGTILFQQTGNWTVLAHAASNNYPDATSASINVF